MAGDMLELAAEQDARVWEEAEHIAIHASIKPKPLTLNPNP